jgi:hypothetical protein
MAKLNFKRWFRNHDNGVREPVAKVVVTFVVDRNMIHSMLCQEMVTFGRDDLDSRAAIESLVRRNLNSAGPQCADYWHENVDNDDAMEIDAIANEWIDRFFPELKLGPSDGA